MLPLLPWKAISITYSECVSLALFVQHKQRLRLIILSSVICAAVRYFSTLPYRQRDFLESY